MAVETVDLAKQIVEAAVGKQATDVVLLDTRNVCSFADYFVICSGESERQIEAIGQAVTEVLDRESAYLHHREGTADSGWVLFDLGDIVVHIFSSFEREYYQLDSLWSKAPVVVRIM